MRALKSLPREVARENANYKRLARQEAFDRRFKARQLLFSLAGGHLNRLSPPEKKFVQSVREEAYQAYLHLFHTGESRYQGWSKRRQLKLVNNIQPMERNRYRILWYASQKARYLRFDLPRTLKNA